MAKRQCSHSRIVSHGGIVVGVWNHVGRGFFPIQCVCHTGSIVSGVADGQVRPMFCQTKGQMFRNEQVRSDERRHPSSSGRRHQGNIVRFIAQCDIPLITLITTTTITTTINMVSNPDVGQVTSLLCTWFSWNVCDHGSFLWHSRDSSKYELWWSIHFLDQQSKRYFIDSKQIEAK